MAKKLLLARVLVDLPQLGCKADDLLEADEAVIKQLAGSVDPHRDAVAYAKNQGAKVRTAEPEVDAAKAAAEKQAARDGLQAEIKSLQERLAAATESEARTAVEAEVAAKQQALAALD